MYMTHEFANHDHRYSIRTCYGSIKLPVDLFLLQFGLLRFAVFNVYNVVTYLVGINKYEVLNLFLME